MFDLDLELRGPMSPRRIRGRVEENAANDVRVDRVFAARERFGSRANFASDRDSRLCVEFRSTMIQERHATNSEKGLRRQKAFAA